MDDDLLEKEYGKEQFTYIQTPYISLRHVFQRLNLQPEDVFYDIETGIGIVTSYAAAVTPAGRVVGIELVEERLDQARRVKNCLGGFVGKYRLKRLCPRVDVELMDDDVCEIVVPRFAPDLAVEDAV